MLLATALGGCGDKHAEGLAMQKALLPQLACGVPELLELARHISKPAMASQNLRILLTLPQVWNVPDMFFRRWVIS